MRLVHLSDLHLGFRQFQRTTPAGINQREADVALSFTRAIDRVIELRPELVLIGGDVFHTVRPTNPAILHAFAQFSRLMRELPDAIVVMVAGNHDMPRSSETTCILRLFAPLGIHVVDSEPRRLRFPEHGLSILAVPDMPPGSVALEPDPDATTNVLVLHGEVAGAIPQHLEHTDRASLQIPAADVSSPGWNYVALGHYHVYKRVGPNAYYSGALDYTSSNPWGEIEEEREQKLPGKGMIERDLVTGKQTFHPLTVARPLVDLTPIAGRGMSAPDLDAAIAAAVDKAPGGIDGKVVRLVARDVPRHVLREVDHKALRDLQRRALHFHLDTRRPEMVRPATSGAPGRRASLADTLRESLRSRTLTSDIDRDALVELGLHYLREAESMGAIRDSAAAAEDA
ncbi:MAG: DNA repair exonuclease [Gemmatimonadetes bacterium]|nr:DNA repair exonuclease [Gemmatimonadota bacterium]